MESESITLARKIECEADGIYFNRCFFKQRFDNKMIVSGHHLAIQSALDRTLLPPSHPDFISRLIITVPPGYSKTEMAAINYMARGLAINPKSRFLHLSYSHKLALLNSTTTRNIITSPLYQSMWPMSIKDDMNSKEMWHTSEGGSVTATSAAGQVTGFRAGHMDGDKFTGALIIDDPVKPDDAYSDTMRGVVNNRYNETIASRVAVETVPIILIMQRIHYQDLAGYLLMGGSGEKWYHLNLSVIINNSKPYPSQYTHGIPLDHKLPDGWLWPFKHNESNEVALRSHRRKFSAQYMQDPIKRGDETPLFTESSIAKARSLKWDTPVRTVVAIDPAVKDRDGGKTKGSIENDEHGIVVATKYRERNRYSIDADVTCRGSPKTWADRAILAYRNYGADAIVIETNQGGDMCSSTLRNAGFEGKIIEVTATKGKAVRAEPVSAIYELGYVAHGPGLSMLEDEMMDFDQLTGKSNGKSPNRLDAAVWALTELAGLAASGLFGYYSKLAQKAEAEKNDTAEAS